MDTTLIFNIGCKGWKFLREESQVKFLASNSVILSFFLVLLAVFFRIVVCRVAGRWCQLHCDEQYPRRTER
jgi:hypothetical protein